MFNAHQGVESVDKTERGQPFLQIPKSMLFSRKKRRDLIGLALMHLRRPFSACRAKWVGSSGCCKDHVKTEQHAIARCSAYDSSRFGGHPMDVPGSPACSAIVRVLFGGSFTGDFGNVADRIIFTERLCCSWACGFVLRYYVSNREVADFLNAH